MRGELGGDELEPTLEACTRQRGVRFATKAAQALERAHVSKQLESKERFDGKEREAHAVPEGAANVNEVEGRHARGCELQRVDDHGHLFELVDIRVYCSGRFLICLACSAGCWWRGRWRGSAW